MLFALAALLNMHLSSDSHTATIIPNANTAQIIFQQEFPFFIFISLWKKRSDGRRSHPSPIKIPAKMAGTRVIRKIYSHWQL
jgi:hypothetical protein